MSGDLPASASSLHYHKTLRIENVSESDAGDYRCTARNKLGSVHHTIHVTVKGMSRMKRTTSSNHPQFCSTISILFVNSPFLTVLIYAQMPMGQCVQ